MRYFRRRRGSDNASGAGGQTLTLSVFIMLLAFFIVLNAISEVRQQKVGPALRSIVETFAMERAAPPALVEEGGEEPEPSGKGDALGALDALFRAELPGIKAERDDGRGVMHVRMTREAFVNALEQAKTVSLPRESVYQWKPGSFVATLVGLTVLLKQGVSLRMDVLLNLAEEPAILRAKDPAALTAAMKEAGGIADILVKAGLLAENLSVGLNKGQPRTVDIYFRQNRPFAPVTEEGGGGNEAGGPVGGSAGTGGP